MSAHPAPSYCAAVRI